MGIFLGLLKFQIFLGCLIFLIFFGGQTVDTGFKPTYEEKKGYPPEAPLPYPLSRHGFLVYTL